MNATKPGSFTPFDSLTARNRSLGLLPEGHRFEPFAAADLDQSIVARFERQVERWPERTAVCMEGQRISYAALNQQANRIAHLLRAAHAGEPAPVALLLAQSPLLIAAILGVLKAGMFYMPLDPDDPPARLGAALAAPPATLLLTDAAYADLAARVVGDTLPLLRADRAGDWPAENLGLDLSPDQLAYLFFTSGTTGKPKSVVDSHRNVLHNIMRYTNRLAIGPDDGLTLIQYSSFSGSVSNIFGALLNGATLFPYDIRRDGAEALGAWLLREPITIYHSVPSIFRAFLAEGRRFERVRIVRLEGDQAAPRDLELFQRHFPPFCRLVNGLGATECGIVRQLFADHQTRIDGPTLPIGYPVEDMEVLLLDDAGQPVAVGETGEMVIRSRYLAVGYWNSPEQTAAAFRDDPQPGFRRYHTGDLGRLHPDGCLEHLGRKTFQAKVLGHSLDLVEIEAALRRVTGVAEAAALVREDAGGEPRLVAYLVPAGAQPPLVTHIRQTLAGWLPDYAIPSAYVFLAALPLNANMKVDRRALPVPGHERPLLATPLVLPRTPVEQRLAELWQAELGIAPVGVHDAFVELGGNSLSAARLLAAVRAAFGAELAPRSLFEPGTVAGLAALLDGEGAPVGVDAGGPQPVARGRDLPLSFAQRRFWLLDQIQPGNPAYLVPLLLDLEGPLDAAVLQRALNALAARHEAFRTSFVHGDDQPLQRIATAGSLPLEIRDLRALPPAQREEAAGDLLHGAARAPFDLARGLLWRALLLRLEEERARLLIVGHHSVTDGLSSGLIGRDLGRLYAAGGDDLPAPALDYADYAVWQQDLPATPAFQRALEHWAARLANPPGPLDLPADMVRPATQSFAGGEVRFTLAPALTAGLRALARTEGATLFMALLAALDALLLRYSGQTDMCVGTAVAERDRPELAEMVGCLLNTLALRVDLAGDPSFRALLGRVRATTLDAYAASVVPFEQARAVAQPAGGAPFQVMLVLQPAAPALPAGPLRIAPLPLHNGTAKFDLTLTITEHPDRLECALEYSGDLFLPATAARLAGHFQTLLAGALAAPETRLSALPLLGEAELRLLRDEGATAAPGLPDGCLHELVAAQAARTPDAPALRFGNRTLSYRELDRRSNQLAQLLRRRGVGPETLVALCAERTPELVIGLLGILKAGGAYIPLDPHFPPERLALMLEDAHPALVLTAGGATAPAGPWATLDLEADWPLVARAPAEPLLQTTVPKNLAYVIYTSGSTGRPKGVQISHAALVNFLRAMAHQPGISPEDVVLLVTTLSFDIAALELFLPLTAGACLQIVPREVLLDGAALARTLRQAGVTLMQATPATWRLLLEAGWEGEPRLTALCGGEAFPRDLADALLGRCRAVWNMYGPTETTIWSAAGELRPDSGPVTLGPPIANTQLYVLDPQMQLVPPGVPGELYIGGDGLARGYGGRPDLTAERFVPNPFGAGGGGLGAGEDHEERRTKNQEPGADDAELNTQHATLTTQQASRLYKTGDLVRRLADGRIEFLGRLDHQVKVRGFRIELGEIETALRAHPDVREAVVLAREDRPGEKRLVAYIVLAQGPERESTKDTKGTDGSGQKEPVAQGQDLGADRAEPRTQHSTLKTPEGEELNTQYAKLKTHLRARLPDYMVPSAFVSLHAFPLTPNGKIDRRALPAPEVEAAPAQSDLLPRGELERTMLAIWAEVLQRERVGVRDNFFDQGGHSLLATRLMVRLQRAFGVDLPMRALFEAPTPAGLAEQVRAAQGREAPPPPEPAPADAAPVLSFAQERLWFLSQLEPDSTAYHTPLVVRLVGRLDRAALERALAQIVRRHAALRTGIVLRDGQPAPTPIDATLPLALDDLSAQDGAARDAAVQRLLLADLGRPFDLERGPVVRARLLRLAADEHILLLVFHHIVCDGWSLALIQGELAAGYSGAPLPELPIQYSDFARWQRQWLDETRQEQLLAYWRARLAGLPRLELPTDRPRPAVRSTQGALHLLRLPDRLLAALDRLCRAEGATRFQVLLAAFQVLLARHSSQRDFAVGTPIAGRTTAAVEELVGFFVNMLVLRADLDGSACFRDLLRRVRATTLDAYAHQDLPFERLVEVLEPDRDLSRTPLVQVVLAFQNTPAATPHLPDLAIAPVALEHVTAKFDLTVIAQEQGDALELAFEYATDLFDADTVARIGARLLMLLEAALDRPDQALDLLPLLPEAEQREVLAWGMPAETPPCEETIHARFARQAAARPQDTALIDGAERLTYAELDRRANRLAHLLRARGVGPDIGVGVAVRRAADLLVALLGILKAGGVCVPLDRDYPPDRIAYMLDNAGIGLVLTDTDSAGQFAAVGHRASAIIDLWVERALIDAQPETTPPEICAPEHLAYVLYTSGSTGRPKGVQITHRAVTRLVIDTNYIDIRPDDRIARVANISFDAAIFEIWSALLHGACLVSFARDVALSPKDFAHGLREAGVTVLFLTTALFNQQVREAPASFAGLRYAVFGGEAADPRRVRELLLSSPPARLLNCYGPTESTTFATWQLIREVAEDAASVPIGVPVSKTTLYVLDRHMQLVPPGVPGELYIGGAGLARGYGGRPDLTAERFVPNPFGAGAWGLGAGEQNQEWRTKNQEPDPDDAELNTQHSKLKTQQASRLYKTGDLVRWTRDGLIEFVARIDAQVKIRGFRIEPGEIEALLASHPDVREVLVLVREDGGDKRLVAYVVPVGQPEHGSTKDTKDTNGSRQEKPVAQGQDLGADGAGLKTQHATLRTFLQERVPDYMVPAAFVLLERFPLTPNGKVDRAALPAPGDEDLARTDTFVAPRNALEEVLAGVWADLLGLARVGVEDSFFALGGHSLLVTQLAAQLRTLFRVDLPLRAVFEATTVADQAALLVAHEPRPGQMERIAQFLQTLHQQQG